MCFPKGISPPSGNPLFVCWRPWVLLFSLCLFWTALFLWGFRCISNTLGKLCSSSSYHSCGHSWLHKEQHWNRGAESVGSSLPEMLKIQVDRALSILL